ncbi:MAG TPA: glycosyltransferase family 9 protein [Vicinamibacterales bacterium]|nr:glycosyltransferase family 9 protein [Vicinamibacterales bacterium]
MNILLVRLRLIGDVVFTTPVIRALRRHYPDARLTYVVEPSAAPILHGNPNLTDIIVIPRRRGLGRLADDLAIGRDLRRRHFDLAIDLHGGPRAAWLTWASGAPRRIGYVTAGRSWMYTDRVERAPDLGPRHAVENQWDLLTPLGIEAPAPGRDAVAMAPDAAAARRVDERLRLAGITSDHPLVIIHVSAGNPFRRWPEAHFVSLIAALVQRDPGRRIVITSGPSDAAAAARVVTEARRALGPLASALPETGEFDLVQLRALICRAAVYIGGDSGPAHIAATTETPIVALLGPTLAERSRPWRDDRWLSVTVDAGSLPCRPCNQRRCAPGDFRCLTGITPSQVAAAVERVLASRPVEAIAPPG